MHPSAARKGLGWLNDRSALVSWALVRAGMQIKATQRWHRLQEADTWEIRLLRKVGLFPGKLTRQTKRAAFQPRDRQRR